MKKLMIIACALAMFACGNGKNATNGNPNKDTTEIAKDAINGTVKDMTKTDGCGFVIEVTLDDKLVSLDPGGLTDEFKVDGKKVKLIYTPSKRMSKCMGTMPIMIEKIWE
jgi:hypothetical protein